MVPRVQLRRRRQRAGRGAHHAGTRPLTSRSSVGARHPAGAAAQRSACWRALLPPRRRGLRARRVGTRAFFFLPLFFFSNQSWLCRRVCLGLKGGNCRGACAAAGGEQQGPCWQVPSLAAAGSLTATAGFSSASSSRGLCRAHRAWPCALEMGTRKATSQE